MATKKFKYQPIYLGFDWVLTLRVNATPALFPAGCAYKAQIRYEEGGAVVGALSTSANTLVRVDDNRLTIKIDGAVSSRWGRNGEQVVMLDLVRTDLASPKHTTIRITIPLEISLTAR